MPLPADWVGVRAANIFTDLHTTWNTEAQHHWAALAVPHPDRVAVENEEQ